MSLARSADALGLLAVTHVWSKSAFSFAASLSELEVRRPLVGDLVRCVVAFGPRLDDTHESRFTRNSVTDTV